MRIVKSCKLKLLLDRINYYEEGIYEIIMSYMYFNLLLYSTSKIRIDVETDLYRMCYFSIKDNIQINLTLDYVENKKILKIDERKYYIYNYVHHKIIDDYLNKDNYLMYKKNHFDNKLRKTNIKNYFILLIKSFIEICFRYNFKKTKYFIDKFRLD